MELGLEFFQMFDRITQDRRARPRDDLATLLATAKMANGEPMGPIETFGYYLIVFTAGHDTTRNALSAGFAAMLQNPDQLELLKRHPELAKRAVEEVVRWASPVNYMKRQVLEDVEIRGQKIRAGDYLGLFYASANRDERRVRGPVPLRHHPAPEPPPRLRHGRALLPRRPPRAREHPRAARGDGRADRAPRVRRRPRRRSTRASSSG